MCMLFADVVRDGLTSINGYFCQICFMTGNRGEGGGKQKYDIFLTFFMCALVIFLYFSTI